jgi:hypothetical protein
LPQQQRHGGEGRHPHSASTAMEYRVSNAARREAPLHRNPRSWADGEAARMLASASMTSVKGAALAGMGNRPTALN